MFVSVIIPTYNEELYISKCIDSLLIQDYPITKIEILIVDGRSIDNTREIVTSYIKRYPFIKLFDNPLKIVPHAMNIGIRLAKGDYIIRLDAHALYSSNYFSALIENAQKYNTDNIGGICTTDVNYKSKKTFAIKTVLSNKFGVGNSAFRVGVTKPELVDTVPFGCFKRDVFDRFGMYDERLERNQDIELNKRILKGGGKILLIPNIKCTYFAREKFSSFANSNYKNGLWNILTVYYTNNFHSLAVRHFVPLIFVLSLILPILLSVFYISLIWVALSSLLVYLFVLLIICFSINKSNIIQIFFLFAAFIVLHTSYGIGSIAGFIKLIKLKIKE